MTTSHGRPPLTRLCAAILVTACCHWNVDVGRCAEKLDLTPSSTKPTPTQDDAGLNAVHFVGKNLGWAAGDHGVVWKTTDGGLNWTLITTGVDDSFRSICFLTDRVGWIVGGSTVPHTRIGLGTILFTNDGGTTWKKFAAGKLPQLHDIEFFDLKRGIAVGESSGDFPTGVMRSDNGGQTWEPLGGKRHTGWRTADFVLNRAGVIGVLAGLRGKTSLVGNTKILPSRLNQASLRGMRGVCLDSTLSGWLVGDGGLVRSTTDGGLVWKDPPKRLPHDVRDAFDFRAVAKQGPQAWIAGDPGSVVWHTPDNGHTWTRQLTGQTVPIHSLQFADESRGWAVGALGMILRTEDGGNTWAAVRGGQRRSALMAVHGHASRVSFNLLAKESGERGYRSVVLLPTRRDVGSEGHAEFDQDLRLNEAVVKAGGSASRIGWQLPVSIPGLDRNRDRLIAEWNSRTDGRLREAFLGRLVCSLRTWRPSIVIIDQPPADDATTILVKEAIELAVKQAADPAFFIEQQQLAALEPWQVNRVIMRLPQGSTGQSHVDPHEYLPRLGKSVQNVSATSYALLSALGRQTAMREAYQTVVDTSASEISQTGLTVGGFFRGLHLTPGSDARRPSVSYDERDDEFRRKLAEKQRHFQAYTENFLGDDRHSGQLLAHLDYITTGMPDDDAALQLVRLANDYRTKSRWDLAEATYVETIERFPNEPATLDAMRQLLQLWVGVEPTWQRAKQVQVSQKTVVTDRAAVLSRIQRAIQNAQSDPSSQDAQVLDLQSDPVTTAEQQGRLKIGPNDEWRQGTVRNWHDQALKMATLIRRKSPQFFRTPGIQFPIASLLRQRGKGRLSDGVYRHSQRLSPEDPWRQTADSELWLLRPYDQPPKSLTKCRRAVKPPYLDGVLGDECWQQADEIRLLAADGESIASGAAAICMLSYDGSFLYLAASIPRVAGTPDDAPVLAGRTHDADLANFDRVNLFIDVDRDYATYYELNIDQRGWTREACWGDESWNPQWYVAMTADKTHWRVEAAIPFAQLAPRPPRPGAAWAVGINRVIPAVGLESWTQPASKVPRPETFGLIRFD